MILFKYPPPKKKDPVYSGIAVESHFKTSKLWLTNRQVQRMKGEHSFIEERRKLGGVALNRNSLEKRRVGSGGGPNWLQSRAACCCWVREEILLVSADPHKLQ